ncbi:EscU/YscU/HrcU family type III secretion system export apparatus switch protein [Schlesneria paludicola]|uniref:EscU/YscU/HrcU family type III secretion system export apparatus switch protein n=1 Tax=Schlesneria paludicola TaxID=360056 RepID=UPI00029B5055|nr:EscU/YscU/HrcU family type III secretion system export apparatus switch protein [Schlesneria paludicola]
MAENEDFDKSELPTQRRRDEARAEGQFAYSHELISGLLLFSGTMGLSWIGLTLVRGMSNDLFLQVGRLPTDVTIDSVQSMVSSVFGSGLQLTGWLIGGLFMVGLAANLAQAGLHFNSESLGPKWDRINPFLNWHKIVSMDGLIRGGSSLLKIIIIGAVSWWVLSDRGGQISALSEGRLGRSVSVAWTLALELLMDISAILLVLGGADYGYQWFRNERRLRMSREQLKQERKEDDGDPMILAKRRQRAREIANQRRMLEDVPTASVVITNPTHLAIALRYERGVDSAPIIVAKGHDQFAFQIASKARRHGIPVVERKPVAQALYKTVKVGQAIPQELFVAVSEVLAYVYRLRGTKA